MSDDDIARKGLRALTRHGVVLMPDVSGIADTGRGGEAVEEAGGAMIVDRSGRVIVDWVPPEVWGSWYRDGFIVASEEGGGYRIAQTGRIQIKRLLSRSDSAAVEGGGKPGEGSVGPGPAPKDRESSVAMGTAGGASAAGDTPLDWLRRRRDRAGRALISAVEFSAGERLRSDFAIGQFEPRTTMSWSPMRDSGRARTWRDGELTLSERAAAARERFRTAMRAVGPDFARVLYDVCCAEIGLGDVEARSGWPRRSGKLVLQLGLRVLARHYGFLSPDDAGGKAAYVPD